MRAAGLPAGLFALIIATPAQAYIGPGAGLGAVAIVIALLLGCVFLVAGLVWYPLKRFIRGRRGPQGEPSPAKRVE